MTKKADYNRLFDPGEETPLVGTEGMFAPDALDTGLYRWADEAIDAVNVALATGRALLLLGDPGIGKSSLAAAVAQALKWRFHRHTVSSRTEAQDLLWRFDAVRRLADAQANARRDQVIDDYDYIEPGPFWWALDPESAKRRGRETVETEAILAKDPIASNAGRLPDGAVLLIDEIDKADPAVTNDLLEPLAQYRFLVDSVRPPFPVAWSGGAPRIVNGRQVSGLLIVFTSNGERDLPPAFIRRCIVHEIRWPDPETDKQGHAAFKSFVLGVAKARWPQIAPGTPFSKESQTIAEAVLDKIEAERSDARNQNKRAPGIAEYLDALRTVERLGIATDSVMWERIRKLVWKKDAQDDAE